MLPPENSKAEVAYNAGIKAARDGKTEKDNPYVLRSVIGLSSWWLSGFISVKNQQKM